MFFLAHYATVMPFQEPITSRKGTARLNLTWARPLECKGMLAVAGNPLVQPHEQLMALPARQI